MEDRDSTIQIRGLVKRYPTRSPGEGGRWGHGGGSVGSFASIKSFFSRHKGPFIEALRGIDLDIKRGEVFGILGPNGAGKSTLIKILCTLVIHDEGEVLVNGIDVKRQPDKVLHNLQAVLPESRGFSWRLSGRQNLEFYAMLYGLDKADSKRRIDYLLDITGLTERQADDYQRYSTGMQRKLLLCRALLRDTPCLLFDEPTSGLDPASGVDFRRLLRDKLARGEGKTVFLSTHNLAEAQDVCDRIAILNRGKIIACDAPAKVQYALSDEKIFEIGVGSLVSSEQFDTLKAKLLAIAGVRDVRIDIETSGNSKLTLRVQKDLSVSPVLAATSGWQIASMNTREPSLEEVFSTMTRRPGRPGFGEK